MCLKILISAGPTREFIDPVRFISNPSSGKMGIAVAEAALRNGHEVTLVLGPVFLPLPDDAHCINVVSGLEMEDAVVSNFPNCDVLIMTAAVGDYRPVKKYSEKLHKTSDKITIEFEKNPDILKEIKKIKTNQIVVGFAAETENMVESGSRKLKEKNLDFIIANKVGTKKSGFGSEKLDAIAIFKNGKKEDLGCCDKKEVAEYIIDKIQNLKSTRHTPGANAKSKI